MSSEPAIVIADVSKVYAIYDRPQDRLRQAIVPRLKRLIGRGEQAATTRYFHEFWALKGISFEVPRGGTVGIVGRNGSGKSTLLQIICGTLTPTAGTVQVDGRVAALLELGSGFNPEFSGRENVFLNASILGLTREQTVARFDDIAAFADIGQFINQPVKTYSSGMVMRLAFAVIAHVDADILVIDEALSVGDAFFTQKCMRFLRRFMQTGTVLFVSHDTSAVTALCDRAIWLEHGVKRMEAPARVVADRYLEALIEDRQGPTRQPPAATTSGSDGTSGSSGTSNSCGTSSSSSSSNSSGTNGSSSEAITDEEGTGGQATIIDDVAINGGEAASTRAPHDNLPAEAPRRARAAGPIHDSRQALRPGNAIQVFEFDPNADGFGAGAGEVLDVRLTAINGAQLAYVVGGEMVALRIIARAREQLDQPIIGFFVRDRLGQNLFGDNTYLTTCAAPLSVNAGDEFVASFEFQMPILPVGDYSITVALANGTQVDHVQHHWVHDALVFRSQTSSLSHGLVGIPMQSVRLESGST